MRLTMANLTQRSSKLWCELGRALGPRRPHIAAGGRVHAGRALPLTDTAMRHCCRVPFALNYVGLAWCVYVITTHYKVQGPLECARWHPRRVWRPLRAAPQATPPARVLFPQSMVLLRVVALRFSVGIRPAGRCTWPGRQRAPA